MRRAIAPLRIHARIGLLVLFSLVVATRTVASTAVRSLSLDDRVAAQRAIEEVYWRHRIWPDVNPSPKPPLSTVLSDEAIRSKVEDYLAMSKALEVWWHRPITPRQLQAELDRMSRNTTDPAMLSELYAALADSPDLIAETLGRQLLVRRLAQNWYASDDRFHGDLERAAREALARIRGVAEMQALGGEYSEVTFVRRSADMPRSTVYSRRNETELQDADWDRRIRTLAGRFSTTAQAIPRQTLSPLQEDTDRFFVVAVLESTDEEVTIATVTWAKRPFSEWWSDQRGLLGPFVPIDGASYRLEEPSGTGCEPDTWDRRFYGPSARQSHTAVWTGTEMIIWGGASYLNSGGRYEPATDTWRETSTEIGVPVPRREHAAVWTGTEMIVWGGVADEGYQNTGGRYDPMTDSWVPTSAGEGTPSARRRPTAVWTGTKMIVWGGEELYARVNTGGRGRG